MQTGLPHRIFHFDQGSVLPNRAHNVIDQPNVRIRLRQPLEYKRFHEIYHSLRIITLKDFLF